MTGDEVALVNTQVLRRGFFFDSTGSLFGLRNDLQELSLLNVGHFANFVRVDCSGTRFVVKRRDTFIHAVI